MEKSMYNREFETVPGAKQAYDKVQKDSANERMKKVACVRSQKRAARREAKEALS